MSKAHQMNVQQSQYSIEIIDSNAKIEHFNTIDFEEFSADEFAKNITQKERFIDCKYQYDNIGSHIFQLQCKQLEYYLTRVEKNILINHISEILEVSKCETLVDLGSGSGEKVISALATLKSLQKPNPPLEYMPIDLNGQVVRDCITSFRATGLENPVYAIVGCYPAVLQAAARRRGPKLFASFGSSISNQDMSEIVNFLSSVRRVVRDEDKFLLGVDITLDCKKILDAYNDRNCVNKIHNLNVLNHVNRRHKADFDVDDFVAVSEFNSNKWRIETYVIPQSDHKVTCLDGELQFSLKAGERVRTEISQKFREEEVISLLATLDFEHIHTWRDQDGHFLLIMFGVNAENLEGN